MLAKVVINIPSYFVLGWPVFRVWHQIKENRWYHLMG